MDGLLIYPHYNVLNAKFFENPEQKLAQRDAAAMQDIFHLSCFMSWLLPKMEVQLGKSSPVLEKIMEMWELGSLGSEDY